jgi:hypothetical protein
MALPMQLLLRGNAGPYNSLVKYKVTPDGEIQTINPPVRNGGSNDRRLGYQASPPEVDDYLRRVTDYPYGSLEEAKSASAEVKQDKKLGALRLEFDKKLNEVKSRENTYNSLSDQNYNSEFTADMIKDPDAPTIEKALNREKFFEEVFIPQSGGSQGILNTFYGGGGTRQGGSNRSIDGYPIMPTYNQFIGNTGRYSHRSDGKQYSMPSIRDNKAEFDAAYNNYVNNIDVSNREKQATYSTELGYSTAARGLSNITNTSRVNLEPVNQAVAALSAKRNYGVSDYASKLNFQVSDDQIIQDLNAAKISKLNNIVNSGNAQIVGIRQRIDDASKLVGSLKAGDARRTTAEKAIASMTSDLNSVNQAISEANENIKNYKPLTASDEMGLKDIVAFREFIQLPEERASQQLRQIDPESYQTSIELGKKYREMATAPIGETQNAQTEAFRAELEKGYRDYSKSPIGATTTAETEALRRRIEDEAMSQLSLGAQLGAEEQRQYQQAARAAQTARGNIFGVAPAVEEAVTTGRAGEERKLARYGAASQFLSSGETTGAALARDVQLREALQQSRLGAGGQFLTSGQTMSDALRGDIAFRDALLQNRLGAASGFVAGGPSIYNLSQARTGQQQGAMQQYIQANQALPGGFNQQASTASPFYQTVDQNIPVALTQAFNDLYRSQSNYQAGTYGAQVGAQAQVASAYSTPNYLSAAGGILGKVSPGGIFGGSGGGPIFCWVAREVYGEENPKWLQFREWMLTKASDNLRNFYTEYGERIAESIRNKPKIKSIIRKWMDSKIG